MKHLLTSTLMVLALIIGAACDAEPDATLRAATCDHTPEAGVELGYGEGGVIVIDSATGLEVTGTICLDEDARIIEHGGAAIGPDGAPWFKPDPSSDLFACKCEDASGVGWTQQCSDPPFDGCYRCCDDYGGGSTIRFLWPLPPAGGA